MAIFLVYSTSGKNVCRPLKMAAILFFKTQLQCDLWCKSTVPNYARKVFSWWWRHRWRHRVPWKLAKYIFDERNCNIFMITKKRANLSSSNFLCIGILRLWPNFSKCVFMTSLMTSPGHWVCEILKVIYLRQYFGITSCKQVCGELKMTAILKFWNIKHTLNLTSDMKRSSRNMSKMFLLWWRHRWRHRLAPKLPCIFIFRRGWLREQVAMAMSRQ